MSNKYGRRLMNAMTEAWRTGLVITLPLETGLTIKLKWRILSTYDVIFTKLKIITHADLQPIFDTVVALGGTLTLTDRVPQENHAILILEIQ
jgi:uncharacterized membrane protein